MCRSDCVSFVAFCGIEGMVALVSDLATIFLQTPEVGKVRGDKKCYFVLCCRFLICPASAGCRKKGSVMYWFPRFAQRERDECFWWRICLPRAYGWSCPLWFRRCVVLFDGACLARIIDSSFGCEVFPCLVFVVKI